MSSINNQILAIPRNPQEIYLIWIRAQIAADRKLKERLDFIDGIRALIFQMKQIEMFTLLFEQEDFLSLYIIVVFIMLTLYHILVYDDEDGFYKYSRGEKILNQYELRKTIGMGTFGCLILANDLMTNQKVAIKLIKRGSHLDSNMNYEYHWLEFIKNNINEEGRKNLVNAMSSSVYNGHRFIVFEVLDRSLREEFKNIGYTGFTLNKIQEITKGVVNGLRYLHEQGIVHADLKPSNIMFTNQITNDIKIIDLGNAFKGYMQFQYSFVQTRSYRAPEVFLYQMFGPEIDIWSAGCIILEMCTGWPIFIAHDASEQICQFAEVLGLPPADYVVDEFCPIDLQEVFSFCNAGSNSIETITAYHNTPLFVEFIHTFLNWAPERRWTAKEILQHPFMTTQLERVEPQIASCSRSSPGRSDLKRESTFTQDERNSPSKRQRRMDLTEPNVDDSKK